jgi:hypothetical protein
LPAMHSTMSQGIAIHHKLSPSRRPTKEPTHKYTKDMWMYPQLLIEEGEGEGR